jgi:hypothetical protein
MFAVVRTACHRQLLACGLISLDDTPVRARNADHPANVQTGRQWLYLGDFGGAFGLIHSGRRCGSTRVVVARRDRDPPAAGRLDLDPLDPRRM